MPTAKPRLRAVFRAHIDATGKLAITEPSRWRGWLARHKGRDVALLVEPEYKPRGLRANAYLWGVVYGALAEWSGHEPEEIHEAMKLKLLPRRVLIMPDGSKAQIAGSTAVLDTAQFAEYVDKVIRYAAECGVCVPAPGEIVEVA
jgi:hypothetical protein